MGRTSVEKFKSAMADRFLHTRMGPFFPSRFRPPFFGHFFRQTDNFINTHLMQRPMVMNSMFPSLFDGIRLGRHHTAAPHLRQTNGRGQHHSSNFRIIPIRVHRGEKKDKSKSLNEANPIVLDGDEAEMIDITGESSGSQIAQTCHRKLAGVDTAITVDDDSHVLSLQQSPAECCADVNKTNLKRSSPVEIVESASPKIKKPNWFNGQSEKMNSQVSNGSMVRSGRLTTDSVITLDDDQETIHIDDLNLDLGFSLQQSSYPISVQKESDQKAVQVEHVESELKTTPNKKSTTSGANSSEVDSISLVAVNIEDKGGIHPSNTETPRNPSLSSLSVSADCHVEELKDSPTPGHPVYEELMTILAKENRKIHYITGDGNCFFRALCKTLYSCETYHSAVRKLIIDIIATNKSRFVQFVDENDVQGHIQKMSEDHCWATTCEIYAAATVLQRDIYVFTPNHLNTNYSWLMFKPVFKTNVPVRFAGHLCYITLCNTNGNHYDLVVAEHGKCNCFLPYPELEGISAVIDLT